MPVGSDAQVDQVEFRRGSGDLLESLCVGGCRSFQVRRFHRHLVNLPGRNRCVIKKTFAQMGKIPVGISWRCHALVDLDNMDSLPRNSGFGQFAQHEPRCTAAAHCDNKSPVAVHCQPGVFSDDCGRSLGHRLSGVHYFNLHLGCGFHDAFLTGGRSPKMMASTAWANPSSSFEVVTNFACACTSGLAFPMAMLIPLFWNMRTSFGMSPIVAISAGG